jgi:hypothetical protein
MACLVEHPASGGRVQRRFVAVQRHWAPCRRGLRAPASTRPEAGDGCSAAQVAARPRARHQAPPLLPACLPQVSQKRTNMPGLKARGRGRGRGRGGGRGGMFMPVPFGYPPFGYPGWAAACAARPWLLLALALPGPPAGTPRRWRAEMPQLRPSARLRHSRGRRRSPAAAERAGCLAAPRAGTFPA